MKHMSKKYFIAVCMKNAGKQWAFVTEWIGNYNLANCELFSDPRVLSANICDSKKAAWDLVNGWNNEFINAGVYLY